ncbi:MAG TPA: hypothetical protein VGB66_11340 [Longimicrobium sp.]|jgi:hypothetical protein
MPFAPSNRFPATLAAACLLLSAPCAAAQGGGPAPWLRVEVGNGLAAAPCVFPCEPEGDIGIVAGAAAGVQSGGVRGGVRVANWTPVFRTPAQSLSTITVRGGTASANGVWILEGGAGRYWFRSGTQTRAQGAAAEMMVSRALGRWRGVRSQLVGGYLHGLGGRIALPDDAPSPGEVPFRPRIVSVGIALVWGAGTR